MVALVSCSAPPYDDQADAQATALQKEVDSQIVKFIADGTEGDAASLADESYASNVKWYNQVDTDLMALQLRMAAAHDKSAAKWPNFFAALRQQIAAVQADHKAKGTLNPIVWIATRDQLNSQFAVLIAYEVSLKNGAPSAAPSSAAAKPAASAAK
jgi:hypothetical protein